jgi:hypothetical protein
MIGGSSPAKGWKIFTTPPRPDRLWGATQPPIHWIPWFRSLGVKRPGREADHLPPSSAEFKNTWSYTSTTQNTFMAWCSVKAQGQICLYLTAPLVVPTLISCANLVFFCEPFFFFFLKINEVRFELRVKDGCRWTDTDQNVDRSLDLDIEPQLRLSSLWFWAGFPGNCDTSPESGRILAQVENYRFYSS